MRKTALNTDILRGVKGDCECLMNHLETTRNRTTVQFLVDSALLRSL